MEPGSIAELVSAFAALGALVAAVVAACAAIRTNRQQKAELDLLVKERRQREDAEERAASSKVAVWIRTDRADKAALRYINASELPVYSLTIWIVIPGHHFSTFYTAIGPSPQSRTLRRGTLDLQNRVVQQCGNIDWTWLLRSESIVASTTFRDLRDVWWHRALSGVLMRHEDGEGARMAAIRDVDCWLARHGEHVCQP